MHHDTVIVLLLRYIPGRHLQYRVIYICCCKLEIRDVVNEEPCAFMVSLVLKHTCLPLSIQFQGDRTVQK